MYNSEDVKSENIIKEKIMARIDSFKHALEEKRAVKVIAGIDNFDIENIKKLYLLLKLLMHQLLIFAQEKISLKKFVQ